MKDHLTRATAGSIRIFAAVTTELTAEAAQRHQCSPVAAAALGRTITGALLLAADLKNDECITLKIEGDGPLGHIVADANHEGCARGYLQQPQLDLPALMGKLPVGVGVGAGILSVTRFTGLKQPFTGSCQLVSGEIAEDLTNYLAVSEQTPSSVGLGVLIGTDGRVSAAGGFWVQAMPGAEDAELETLEQNIKKLPPLSQLIADGADAKKIIELLTENMTVNYHGETALRFGCQCSWQRIGEVLTSMGRTELEKLSEDENTEVCCQFCGEKYQFSKQDIKELLS